MLIAAIALAAGLVVIYRAPGSGAAQVSSNGQASSKEGSIAPDFVAPSLSGGRIRLKDFRGKVVILDFWSINCSPCIEANKSLNMLYSDYHSLGLEIVGLSMDQAPKMVEMFLKSNPVKYTVGMATDEVITKYGGVFSLPQTLVIDRNGRIARRYEGYSPLSVHDMERVVKSLLKNQG